MFLSTISRLLSAWFAFLLPCFATYKALSRRPLSEAELHKWSMYWAVIGAFMAFEYLAEWTISWLPFYWELKTIFLLFLSLPQTQGSTYIYTMYLQPYFSRHEAELDAGIIAIQRNIVTFIQGKMASIWDFIWAKSMGARGQTESSASTAPPQMAWLLSSDAWRSAMNILKPASATTPPPLATSRQNSNVGAAAAGSRTPSIYNEPQGQAPPFPVPQHYE